MLPRPTEREGVPNIRMNIYVRRNQASSCLRRAPFGPVGNQSKCDSESATEGSGSRSLCLNTAIVASWHRSVHAAKTRNCRSRSLEGPAAAELGPAAAHLGPAAAQLDPAAAQNGSAAA